MGAVSHGRWCTRTDALLVVEGIHVNSGNRERPGSARQGRRNLTGWPDCSVVAGGPARRQVRLHDIPSLGRPLRLLRAKRIWRYSDPDCLRTTFTEEPAGRTAGRKEIRSAGSAGPCRSAPNPSRRNRLPGSMRNSRPGTRARKPPLAWQCYQSCAASTVEGHPWTLDRWGNAAPPARTVELLGKAAAVHAKYRPRPDGIRSQPPRVPGTPTNAVDMKGASAKTRKNFEVGGNEMAIPGSTRAGRSRDRQNGRRPTHKSCKLHVMLIDDISTHPS